jgi:4-hydroxybenzoate polyprenyltransferase
MATVKNYLSLIKFSHTIFAMPFALIGFVLGLKPYIEVFQNKDGEFVNSYRAYEIDGKIVTAEVFKYAQIKYLAVVFLLVIICMVSARSAAMAFNRYLDRKFDALNPRTAIREIPKGIISPKNALAFTIGSSLVFVVACYFINTAVLILSPIALFVVLFYSYTKRFTALCHLVLGVGLALAPIGAYLAVTGSFAWLPLLFSFAVIFWVSGFDIIFALQDVEFDQSQKLHSIPAMLGVPKALRVSELLHLISAACVIAAGFYGHFHWLYWIGVAVFTSMLVYQHSIVKPNDLSKVNIAFMTANGIASVVFAVFVIADLLVL